MGRWLAAFCIFVALMSVTAVTAWAQSAQSFVGDWTVEGGSLGPCRLTLSGQAMGGQLKATTYTCAGAMSFAWAWSAQPSGITLLGINNVQIGSFQLERGVLAGRMNDGSLVTLRPASGQQFGRRELSRGNGWQDSPGNSGQSAGRREDCYMREDIYRCADVDDVPPPRGRRHVRVIRQINVREAVDMSSPVISQLQGGQCYVIDGCQDSQWGPRCKIRFNNGVTGYTIKYYENNGQNFVAFLNRC